jgi:hypothetical protein
MISSNKLMKMQEHKSIMSMRGYRYTCRNFHILEGPRDSDNTTLFRGLQIYKSKTK